MGRFHEHLKGGDAPAIALQKTQNYLRKLTPAAMAAELARIQAGISAAEATYGRGATRYRIQCLEQVPQVDLSHPFYWAPYILVG